MALDSLRSNGSFGASFRATECPICMSVFNSTRTPLSTPCGHTLCRNCARSLADADADDGDDRTRAHSFECPMCREPIPSLSKLKINYALLDLINQVRELTRPRERSGASSSAAAVATGAALSGLVSRFLSIDFSDLEFDDMLDSGAFGEVHRGRWLGNVVAIKVIRAKDLSPEAIESFHREIEVMNCLRHPNVVMLMAACKQPPRLSIVMEFVGGGSLYWLLHAVQYRLKDGELKKLALDVCSGLQYLHSINIMHRDLKSKNVLLSTSRPPVAKLCDFGLSRMRLESATMTGHVGTAQWTAPEIINDSHYTFKADIYSLGMVLLEMGTNKVPFPGMHPLAILMAVGVKKKSPPIPEFVNLHWANLIRDCVKWEPVERPLVLRVIERLEAFHAMESGNNLCVTDLTQERVVDRVESKTDGACGCDEDKRDAAAANEDSQLIADFVLAAQLQEEENKGLEDLTSRDSLLAKQLSFIEAAKVDRGVARVDVSKGIPFNPKQEIVAAIKNHFAQTEKLSKDPPAPPPPPPPPPLPVAAEKRKSRQWVEYEPGSKPGNAVPWGESEPMLSSLVRQPSRPLAFESNGRVQGSPKWKEPENAAAAAAVTDAYSESETKESDADLAEKSFEVGPEKDQTKPGFITRSLRRMSEVFQRSPQKETTGEQSPDGGESRPRFRFRDKTRRSPPFCVEGSAFMRVVASLKSMIPDKEVLWNGPADKNALLSKTLSLPSNLDKNKARSTGDVSEDAEATGFVRENSTPSRGNDDERPVSGRNRGWTLGTESRESEV